MDAQFRVAHPVSQDRAARRDRGRWGSTRTRSMTSIRPRLYLIRPPRCSFPAARVTLVRRAPSISARNSWVNSKRSDSRRSRTISNQRARRCSISWRPWQAASWLRMKPWLCTHSRMRWESGPGTRNNCCKSAKGMRKAVPSLWIKAVVGAEAGPSRLIASTRPSRRLRLLRRRT